MAVEEGCDVCGYDFCLCDEVEVEEENTECSSCNRSRCACDEMYDNYTDQMMMIYED